MEQVQSGEGKKRGRRATGRKDAEKVAAVQKPKVIADRLDELVKLHREAKEASEAAAEAITKAAEDSGYLASSVKKLVVAKSGEKYEEKKREVAQQHELFEEVE